MYYLTTANIIGWVLIGVGLGVGITHFVIWILSILIERDNARAELTKLRKE